MAWTAPRTWVVGEIVTAALMNTHIRDNTRYLKGLDGVVTTESGLIIDNTGGDEYVKLPLLSTAEANSVLDAEGKIAFDETTHQLKLHNGTAVKAVISEADVDDTPVNGADTVPISSNWAYDFQQTLTTAGDLPYATGASVWARLGIGTNGQFLKTNAGATAPEWVTVTGVQIASSTYTGNDTNDRQITTGFQCALVIVWTDVGADCTWICFRTNVCTKLCNTPSIAKATDVLLHASDGFVVDQENANHNGETYYYCAIG